MSLPKILIAITGASGSIYGKVLMEKLRTMERQFAAVGVIFTQNGKDVWAYELGEPANAPKTFKVFSNEDLFASPASGSSGFTHMIICPCSMASMAKIAHGISTDLISRAADVMLKERRKLILLSREMPYSLIHIENMLTVTRAGGIICPASPSFYSKPLKMDDLILTVVEKVLSLCAWNEGGFEWGKED